MLTTALLLAALATAPTARPDIVLRANAVVEGPRILLGNVADLTEIARSDAALARRLSSLTIATVRAGQSEQLLDVQQVRHRIRRAAPNRIGQVATDDSSNKVVVRSTLRPIESSHLAAAVIQHWLVVCRQIAEDCQASATADDERLEVPAGIVSFHPVMPPRWHEGAPSASVPVGIAVDGIDVGSVRVRLDWQASLQVWVLQSAVERGEVVRSEDVARTRQRAPHLQADALIYDGRARLVRASRALDAGTLLLSRDPRVLAQFRRGDDVDVAMAIGSVTVQRKGPAMEDGRAGARAFVQLGGEAVEATVVQRVESADKGRIE